MTTTLEKATFADSIQIVDGDYNTVMIDYGFDWASKLAEVRYENPTVYKMLEAELPGKALYSGLYKVGDNQLLTVRKINDEGRVVLVNLQLDLYTSVTELID